MNVRLVETCDGPGASGAIQRRMGAGVPGRFFVSSIESFLLESFQWVITLECSLGVNKAVLKRRVYGFSGVDSPVSTNRHGPLYIK